MRIIRSVAAGCIAACAALALDVRAQIHTSPNDGPGLGNLTYTQAACTRVGTPFPPSFSPTNARMGWGNVDMINGYLWFHMESDGGGNANNGAFEFWDVSNPHAPVRAFRHDTPDTRRGRENHGFGTSSSYPGDYLVMQAHTGLLFWDMTDPGNPVMLSAMALPGIAAADYNGAWWSFWQAPYVFVAGQNQGLYVVDATDPRNPVLVRRMLTSQTGGFNIGFVQAVGNLLIANGVQQNGRFMSTLDISDPVNPVVLNTYNWGTTRNGYSHTVSGGKIYTAGGDGGLVQLREYNLTHDGVITTGRDAPPLPGTGNHENGGYLSIWQGHVFSGFSNRIVKVRRDTMQTVCQMSPGLSGDDEDFAVALGNIVFNGDDHGINSHLFAHQAAPDTVGPEVEWMHPAGGSTNVASTSRVGVTMSEIFNLDSVTSQSFIVRPLGGTALPGKYSKQHHILNFSPDQPLDPFTTYEVVIQGIKDHVGNAGGVFTASFSTGDTVAPPAVQNPTFADGSAGQTGAFTAGAGLYADRPSGSSPQVFVATPYPAALEGQPYVLTRNDDKQSTAANAVNFSLNLDSNVYVLLDGNRVPVPAWLSSWTATGETVNTTDSGSPTRQVYVKQHGIGQVSLGGNAAPSASSSMYSVVIAPLAQSIPTCQISSPGPVEVGASASFTATSTGNSVIYSWSFGDGSPNTAGSPNPQASHVFSQPGRYSVVLEALNNVGRGSCALTQIVHRPLTAQPPTQSGTLVAAGNVAYLVNADSNTVAAVDGVSLQKLWEVSTGQHPRTLALAPNGDLWVVNQDDATISVLDTAGFVRNTHALRHASKPYGIAFGPDGKAYVTLTGTGELVRLNANGTVEASVDIGHKPRGIAISGNGERILVTQFVSTDEVGRVREVDASTFSVVRTFELAFDHAGPDGSVSGRGVPNYVTSLAISPDGQTAAVPSKKDNLARGMFRDGQMLNFETMVRAIVSRIDLLANQENFAMRVDIDDRSMPQAAIFSPVGDLVLVSTQGTNTVEVFDAYNPSSRITSIENAAGLAPQGLALSGDGTRLFVHNFMGRSVSVLDVGDLIAGRANAAPLLAMIDTVATESLTAQQLLGKRIFYNANDSRMARDKYISCAACHLDGDSDQQVWDFTQVGEGFRNTISLLGRAGMGHGRVHWTANFDEIQDFENDIRHFAGGSGFMSDTDFAATSDPLGAPKAGRSAELDALAAFVSSLDKMAPSPYRNADGSLTAEGVQGRSVFQAKGCASCHAGTRFTDQRRWDVGTVQPHSGLGIGEPLAGVGFDTPTLLDVWATAPYLHDGSAKTLRDVLGNPQHTGSLSEQEKDGLVAYLQQIDRPEAASISVPAGGQRNGNVSLMTGESLQLGAGASLNGNLTGAASTALFAGNDARVNGNVKDVTNVVYGAGVRQNGNATGVGTLRATTAGTAVTINGNVQAGALALDPGAWVVINGNLNAGSVTLAAGAKLEVNGNAVCTAATKGEGATVVVRGNKQCPGL